MSKRSKAQLVQEIRSLRRRLSVKINLLIAQIPVEKQRTTSRRIKRRRTLKPTSSRRMALRRQGKYMGLSRRLSARKKKEAKKVFKEDGIDIAIWYIKYISSA